MELLRNGICHVLAAIILLSPLGVFAQGEAVGTSTDALVSLTTAPQITLEQIPGTDVQLGDFVVGPGKVEVEVRPGQTVYREVTVTNRIDDNRTFEFYIEDMSGSADGTEAAVLLGDQNGPYSLRDFVSVPSETVTLGLGQRARVPVRISMPENAEPGGYYGAVLVSTVQKNSAGETMVQSPVVARIGTLFFITVPGAAERSGDLLEFSTQNDQRWFQQGPVTFHIAYENTGSVHQNPYGELRITNLFGQEVGYVALDPWFVLPKSVRTREVTWDSELLLGRYKVEATINRGYNDVTDIASLHIWVIPWQLLTTVFVVLFVIIFVFRWFFSKFELKRK